MLRPMFISALGVDSLTKHPVVILKDVNEERTLPIWIGVLEAYAIINEMKGVKLIRPSTHDLLKNILDLIKVKVNKIEISDLINDTYYALIYINHKGNDISIDARPSDALALSLRVGAPIYATEKAINKSPRIDLKIKQEDKPEKAEKWYNILEKLKPEDFGRA